MTLNISYNLSISYRLLLLLISMIIVSTMTGSSNNHNLMIETNLMNRHHYHRQSLLTSKSNLYTDHHKRLLLSIIGGSRIRKTSSKANQKKKENEKNNNNSDGDVKLNTFQYKNRPLITVKLAISKNGAVDDESGKPYRFTCTNALKAVHRLRRDCDAVLIGINTVLRDDPSLTIRHVKPKMKKRIINAGESGQEEEIEQQPIRIILDNNLRIPNNATVLNDGYQTLIYYNNMSMNMNIRDEMKEKIQHHINNKNVNFIPIPIRIPIEEKGEEAKQKICDYYYPQQQQYYTKQLKYLLADLIHKRNIRHLMIEGGPQIIQNFFTNHFVDRFILIQSSTSFLNKPIFCKFLKCNNQQNDQSNHEFEYEFTRYGLKQIKNLKWGEDNVTYFSIPNLPWSSTPYI